MSTELPDYYFRVRENGAFVFRVDTENRQRRIAMEQIAVINVKNGEFKAHGDRVLSDADTAAISAWMEQRTALLAKRDSDDIHRAIAERKHAAVTGLAAAACVEHGAVEGDAASVDGGHKRGAFARVSVVAENQFGHGAIRTTAGWAGPWRAGTPD